jgi:serine/threonine protein kinase
MIGTVLANQYEIVEVIGEGGIGVVYRARQLTVNRDVAIKILKEEYAKDELTVRRFENEAQAISKLRHPNTLRLYDVQRSAEGTLYIVTELLTGRSLSDVLANEGRMSIDRAVRTIDEVCRSLGEAHTASIVHRDLKPANIFLDRIGNEDVVKVLDFGIAKILQGGGGLTRAGVVPGTPQYMSPEQATMQRVDHRADIYALGIILHQMVAGRAPFDGPTVLEILRKQIEEPPPKLSEAAPDLSIPPELEKLVLWMLAKTPEERPSSVDAIRNHLPRILAFASPALMWDAPPPKRRGSSLGGGATKPSLPVFRVAPPPRSSRQVLAIAAGVALGIGIGLLAAAATRTQVQSKSDAVIVQPIPSKPATPIATPPVEPSTTSAARVELVTVEPPPAPPTPPPVQVVEATPPKPPEPVVVKRKRAAKRKGR